MKDLKIMNTILNVLLLLGLIVPAFCFSPHVYQQRTRSSSSSLASSTETASLSQVEEDAIATDNEENAHYHIRSPLRMLGPYPTIPLSFPNLATSSQRERNITGVSLDWVLDTAANTNTINNQVALELCLEKVGEAPGGVGSGGAINGGDTFLLGDCELDIKINDSKPSEDDNVVAEDDEPEPFTFMKELTASALPVASPAAAGLLGLAFFYCFEGGVEFNWGLNKQQTPPSVLFYGSDKHLDADGLTLVPFESLPESLLPSVTLIINGKEIPALFDTGSPLTVINQAAAIEAGIETIIPSDVVNPDNKSKEGNFLSKIASNFKSANEIAKATQSGDILTIQGTDGKPTRLVKTKEQQDIHIRASSSSKKLLPSSQIFVGDIPGLVALGGIQGDAAAILGMDILSRCDRVIFRARQNEIYL